MATAIDRTSIRPGSGDGERPVDVRVAKLDRHKLGRVRPIESADLLGSRSLRARAICVPSNGTFRAPERAETLSVMGRSAVIRMPDIGRV